jgi:hypothetical protein
MLAARAAGLGHKLWSVARAQNGLSPMRRTAPFTADTSTLHWMVCAPSYLPSRSSNGDRARAGGRTAYQGLKSENAGSLRAGRGD